MCTYFQEKVADLQGDGLSERDAARTAIKSFGRARVVARQMYEAYSKGSWLDAALSSLPHFIIVTLFATHMWHNPVVGSSAFIFIVLVTLFGWWHGQPNWLYSWVGYSLLPLLLTAYVTWPAARQAGGSLLGGRGDILDLLLLLGLSTFYVLSLTVVVSTTVKVLKRDWILVSLMLVPLPILGSWLVNIESAGGLFQDSSSALYLWDSLVAPVFLMLALASAAFIRLRLRILKTGAVLTVGVISGTIAGYNFLGLPGFLGLLGTALFLLLFLLSPALLEARVGHGAQRGAAGGADDWVEHPSRTG
jgi:hypothetical protein